MTVQSIITCKISHFLVEIEGGEGLPVWSAGGLCNAFAFMNFRADVHHKIHEVQYRLQEILNASDVKLKHLASTLKKYKAFHAKLINSYNKNDILYDLNTRIMWLEKHLHRTKAMNDKLKHYREIREHIIQARFKMFYFSEASCLQEAQDYYYFAHSLLGAFNPGNSLHYKSHDRLVIQYDFKSIMRLLPIDDDEQNPPSQKLKLAFNFSEDELRDLFSNQFDSNTFLEGDCIRVSSPGHALYVKRSNGKYQLYNPILCELEDGRTFLTAKELVQQLRTAFNVKNELFALGMVVYASDHDAGIKLSTKAIIKAIINKRAMQQDYIDINSSSGDAFKTSSLWMAAAYGSSTVLSLLVKLRAYIDNPDASGITSLWVASQNGHVETVRKLIKLKANIEACDKNGNNALAIAAHEGHVQVVELLLKSKAAINSINNHGTSAAYFAAQNDFPEMIKILKKYKSDLNKANHYGMTPTYIAAYNGNVSALQALIETNANVMLPDLEGNTPAYIAAQQGNTNILHLLYAHKIRINQSNENHLTAMYIGSHQGKIKVVKLLLEAKVTAYPRDNNGCNPFMAALLNEHWNVVTLFLKRQEFRKMVNGLDRLSLTDKMVLLQQFKKILSNTDLVINKIAKPVSDALYQFSVKLENTIDTEDIILNIDEIKNIIFSDKSKNNMKSIDMIEIFIKYINESEFHRENHYFLKLLNDCRDGLIVRYPYDANQAAVKRQLVSLILTKSKSDYLIELNKSSRFIV